MTREVAVIGASVAGVHFVRALRDRGFDGVVRLIGAEPFLPYDRPPLSKEFLCGERAQSDILLAPEGFYAESDVDLLLGTPAQRIEPGRILLQNGQAVPFDRLFVATGSSPVRLRVPGAELEGVYYLRTLEDAERLRTAIGSAARAVVVGGGFIGAEVAASCRAAGLETTIVEAAAMPFAQRFGEDIARALVGLQERHGVSYRLGVGVASLGGHGRVDLVELSDGTQLPADLVVIGVGARPNIDLFTASGFAVDDGVEVRADLATSMPNVYAGGDCARFPHRGRAIRVEHWDTARTMGEHAAGSVLGETAPYAASPFFWTDQYDRTVQYFGHHGRGAQMVLRGDPTSLEFAAFYLHGGRIAAACTAGRTREALAVRRLVEHAAEVPAHVLENLSTDLRALAREIAARGNG